MKITPSDARHVLWFFNDIRGIRPGSFTTHLMEAMGSADGTNLAKLTDAFPALGKLFIIVKHHPLGLEKVRQFVDDGEEVDSKVLDRFIIEAGLR